MYAVKVCANAGVHVCWLQLQEREWEDQLQLMRVQTDITRKEREALKLREKMREMGLDKYDE